MFTHAMCIMQPIPSGMLAFELCVDDKPGGRENNVREHPKNMKIYFLAFLCLFVLHVHSIGGVCDETAEKVEAALRTGVSTSQGKTAILSRCNVSVFSEAVRLIDANPLCRVHFIGVSVLHTFTDAHKAMLTVSPYLQCLGSASWLQAVALFSVVSSPLTFHHGAKKSAFPKM